MAIVQHDVTAQHDVTVLHDMAVQHDATLYVTIYNDTTLYTQNSILHYSVSTLSNVTINKTDTCY